MRPHRAYPYPPFPTPFCAAEAVADAREGWELHPDDVRIPNTSAILGRGSFGVVYRGELHGSEVAVKVVHYASNKKAVIDGFAQEVALMTKLHHPNICMILGVAIDPRKRSISIVTELLPVGSLCVSPPSGSVHAHRNPPLPSLAPR